MSIGTTPQFIPIPTGEMSTGQDVTSDPWRAAVTDLQWLYDHYGARSPVRRFDPPWYRSSTTFNVAPEAPPEGRGSKMSLGDLQPVTYPRREAAASQLYADSVLLRVEIAATDGMELEIRTERIDNEGPNTALTTIATQTLTGAAETVDYALFFVDINGHPIRHQFQARSTTGNLEELRGIYIYEPVPAISEYPTQFKP